MKIKLKQKMLRYAASLRKLAARHALGHKLLHAGLVVLLACVAAQITVFAFNTIRRHDPILGLRFEGHMVGQLFGNGEKQEVASIIEADENKALNVQVAGYSGTVTLRQLGAKTNVDKVYNELLRVGRSGNIFSMLLEQSKAPVGAVDVSLPSPIDTQLAQAYITSIDQQVDVAPANAYFAWQGQTVVVHPDTQGMIIDMDGALTALRHADTRSGRPVVLPIKNTIATITAAMLEPHLAAVRNIAQKPLVIGAAESTITLSGEQLVGMVAPKVIPDPQDPTKQVVQITFDEAKVKGAVDEVIKQAAITPKPTIVSGGRVVQQGKSGRQPANDHALADVLAALIQRQTGAAVPESVQIPMVTVEPPVVHQAVASGASNRTGTGLVRLTFDDGPGGYTNQILDILKRYNVRATFYVVGQNVPRYAEQMQRTKNEGHRICSHSYTHANLARLSRAGVHRELADTASVIQQATGVSINCFRPPYGSHNATVREVAGGLGQSVDMWSVDPRDWAQPGSGVIRQRILNNVHSGAVVLLHVLNQQTVNALPGIIEGIRAQGYTLE